ncbi:urotensin-2 receptor [Erpetoichthys calabaricus]|uniref:urotensin-2 receptor n=1 Tax=Erpetoichthys calabaricus TaxID=27687 RepID=UPI0010A07042|nr:urotensin-2 receptor [Erpetoichthys calabaricus]
MEMMENEAVASVIRTNRTTATNTSVDFSGSFNEMLVTSLLGTILIAMCLVGVTGNVYTLVVMNISMRVTGSMYVYIVNLALADLLYLSTIPFVVCTYFVKDWYFGDIGCRVLFSLDLLTMQASIFILTVMSTERYFAVVKPLDTFGRSRKYRKTVTCVVWLLSFLLALPTMIMIDLRTSHQNGEVKRMCHPTWQMEAYKVYLTVLFNTCILAPGFVIGYLYVRLARTYWISQTRVLTTQDVNRCPKQKVLYMILSIVLVYCACFIPFWLWQLLYIYYYRRGNLSPKTVFYVNFVVTCLAYSNSCINPFLYTLLTKNYKEYLKNRPRGSGGFKGKSNRHSSRRSVSSGGPQYTETMTVLHPKGVTGEPCPV